MRNVYEAMNKLGLDLWMDCSNVFILFLVLTKRDNELTMTYIVVRMHDWTLLDKMVPFYFKVSRLKYHVCITSPLGNSLTYRLINRCSYPSMENWVPKNKLMRPTVLFAQWILEKRWGEGTCFFKTLESNLSNFGRYCLPVCKWDIWFTNGTVSACEW